MHAEKNSDRKLSTGCLGTLLSDLDQCCQLGPGLPQLLGFGKDVPARWNVLESEGETRVRELSSRGEQELGVGQQEVQL